MSNPTPGPWNLVKRSVMGNGFYGIQSYLAAPDGKPICTFDDYPSDEDERLMVAAPSLRDALKRWEQFAQDNGWTDADCTFLTQTRAALAAAEPIPPYLLTITRKDGTQYTDTAKTANDANRMENDYWDRADQCHKRRPLPYTDTAKTANDANRMENDYWDRADQCHKRRPLPSGGG